MTTTPDDRDVPPIDLASAILHIADTEEITDYIQLTDHLTGCWIARKNDALLQDRTQMGIDRFGKHFTTMIEMTFWCCGSDREFDDTIAEILESGSLRNTD